MKKEPIFSELCAALPVSAGQSGDWRIEDYEVSKKDSDFTSIRAMMHPDEYVPAGKYKRLMRGGIVVMSNTPYEIRTNRYFFHRATGRVLINGLGLGMLLYALLQKQDVTEVWVIEKSPDVIALVSPTFAHDKRVKIIEADALTYKPPKGIRFNAVFHDIWDNICTDNLEFMGVLHRKYGRICDYQGSWCRAELKLQKQRDKRMPWY